MQPQDFESMENNASHNNIASRKKDAPQMQSMNKISALLESSMKETQAIRSDKCYEGVSSEIISNDTVKDQDVLFGRGKRAMYHPGNKYYQEIVSTLSKQYKTCNKLQKTALSKSIVYTIHSHGGRFLTPLSNDNRSWVEVNGLALRKKTSQALRDCRLSQIRRKKTKRKM